MLISNDYTDVQYYREVAQCHYPHMLMPCMIPDADFNVLVRDFYDIDFKKTQIQVISDAFSDVLNYTKWHSSMYQVTVDDRIRLGFNHYIEDDVHQTPTMKTTPNGYLNIWYNDMQSYIKSRYYERLKRFMVNIRTTRPTFMFVEQPSTKLSDMQDFIDIETPCKKILYTSNEPLASQARRGLTVHVVTKKDINWKTFIKSTQWVAENSIFKYEKNI